MYIGHLRRKPKFNHVEIKIRIVTSLSLKILKYQEDRIVAREMEMNNRNLHEAQIWAKMLEKKNIQYHPAIILIGADPNDNKAGIKREFLRRINTEGHKVKDDRIEVQLKGLIFPAVLGNKRQTITRWDIVRWWMPSWDLR